MRNLNELKKMKSQKQKKLFAYLKLVADKIFCDQ
jgi:hypothetical protein